MSLAVWGAVLGAACASGVLVVGWRLIAMRRPSLAIRVLPFVRDLPETASARLQATSTSNGSAASAVFGPLLRQAADTVEKVLGGASSVRRRLERANIDRSVQEFRVEQVMWGLAGFAVMAAWGLLDALTGSADALASLILCGVGFCVGVLARDNRLTSQARDRERRILLEFPAVAELLALSVAAGESPLAALARVVERSRGELSADLARVLAEARTGVPVSQAFDGFAARTGVPLVARFAEGIAVAIERGTPLTDVLHAQAADVRESGRRELIETAARKEVFMMVPVVFLILPVTVLFAFWPGFIGLSLTAP